MKKGGMGQLVMCALGGIFVGRLLGIYTPLGDLSGLICGILLGIMTDIYLSFFSGRK